MTRRLVLASALLLLLAVMALTVFAGWLVGTEAGLRFTLARLETLSAVSITARGPRGTIRGPLYFESLLVEHEAVRIEARGVELEPELQSLLTRTISIARVRVAELTVTMHRREPEPPSEPHFMPPLLRLVVPVLEIANLALVLPDGQRFTAARIDGGVDMDRRTLRVPRLAVSDPAGELTGDVLLGAAVPLAVRGAIRGHWRLPDEHVYRFALGASGDLDRLATTLRLSEPAQLSFQGTALDLSEAPRVVGTVRAVGFDGSPWIEAGRFPKVSGSVALDAGSKSIGLDGTFTAEPLGAQPLRVQGGGSWREKVIEIASLRAWLPRSGASFTTAGTIDLRPDDPVLTLAGEWTDLRWPLTGEAKVESALGAYRIGGGLPYAFEARAETTAPGFPAAAWQASGLVDRDSVTLDTAEAYTLRGRVRAAGRLTWTGDQSWRLTADGRSLDLRELRPDLPSRINVAGAIEGRGLSAAAPWTARIDSLDGTLAGRALSGRGRIAHRDGEFQLTGLRVTNGESFARVDGRYGRTIDLDWAADLRTLKLIEPGMGGRLQASGRVRGPRERPSIVGEARLTDATREEIVIGSAELELDLDLADTRESSLELKARNLDLGGLLVEDLRLSAHGRASGHEIELDLFVPGDAQGRFADMRARLAARGEVAVKQRSWNGELTETVLAYADGSASLVQPAAVVISPETARAAPVCLAIEESRLCAEGEWDAKPERWRLIYSAQDWPLRSILRSLLGWRDFDGVLRGGGWIGKEPGQAWMAGSTILLEETTFDIPRNRFRSERVRLGGGRLDLFADSERIRSNLRLDIGEQTKVDGEVHAERLAGRPMAEYPLSGHIRGESAELTGISVLVSEIDRAKGSVAAEVNIGGTLGEPRFDGEFHVRDAEFALYRTNFILSDTQLDGRFKGDELVFEGRGTTSGGSLSLEGRFRWPEGVMTGSMQLRGDRLLVADTPEYRVVASPSLDFNAGPEGFRVTGRVDIPTARITPRDLTASVRTSSDERIVGLDLEEEGPSTLDRVTTRIDVVLGDDVRVESFGLRARLDGAVTVHTRPRDVARGRGAINVAEGQYRAFGTDVRITRGRLTFEDSPLSEPILDLVAERRIEVEDVTVAVNVRGPLDSPFITLTSTPSMSNNEALSYLLTGRSINNLQSGEARTVDAAAEGLALGGGGLLLGGIGQRLGLDEVTVERTGTDDTSVVLGKALSPRLFVSYGISIAEAINTIKLRYTLNERWSLKAEAGLEQSGDVEFRIERP